MDLDGGIALSGAGQHYSFFFNIGITRLLKVSKCSGAWSVMPCPRRPQIVSCLLLTANCARSRSSPPLFGMFCDWCSSRSVGSRVSVSGQCKNGHTGKVRGSGGWRDDGEGERQGEEEVDTVPASRGLLLEFVWSSGPKPPTLMGCSGAQCESSVHFSGRFGVNP